MAMGECSVYGSVQAESMIKFAAWSRVDGHLALTDFRAEDPK